jgi:hypothetical protein
MTNASCNHDQMRADIPECSGEPLEPFEGKTVNETSAHDIETESFSDLDRRTIIHLKSLETYGCSFDAKAFGLHRCRDG